MSSSQQPGTVSPASPPYGSGSHEFVDPLGTYIAVFISLMTLLALTVGAYYIPFERWFGEQYGYLNTILALIIATIKASLVMVVFMHLRHSTKLTWVISLAGFMWLCIMLTFTFTDYLSRVPTETVHQPAPMITHLADRNPFETPIP